MKPLTPAPLVDETIVEYIQRNWRQIDCSTLSALDDAAMVAALLAGDYTADFVAAGFKAIGVALDAAWYTVGCGVDDKPEWPDDPLWQVGQQCQKVSEAGTLTVTKIYGNGNQEFEQLEDFPSAHEIVDWTVTGPGEAQVIYLSWPEKEVRSRTATSTENCQFYFWIQPEKNCYCIDQAPDREPPDTIGPILIEPEIQECKWSVQPVSSHVDAQGVYWTKYAVSPNDPLCGSTFYYWGSQRGPVFCPPEDPNCTAPDQRGTTSIPSVDGFYYWLEGNCEDPEEWGLEDPEEQPYFEWRGERRNGIESIAERIDALAAMVELSFYMKNRTCNCSDRPKLEGRWVTAQWISEENSPGSRLPLRKLTRWRSKSGRTDAELAEFFKDFRWDAGPVCVRHKGAWWGEPQVWALTPAEGRRVIREIGREAGIDPDMEGEWADSISRNPRYGMTGRMRLRKLEGHPWISSRNGSNMLPMG